MTTKSISKIKKAARQMGSLGWLARLTKSFLPRLLFLVFLSILTVLLGIASSIASKYVVDSAASAKPMIIAVIIMIAVTLVILVLSFSSSLISTVVNEKYAFHIRQNMFDRILKTIWIDIIKYHSGDLLTRLKSDIGTITGGVTDVIPQIITMTVQLFAAFLTLLHFDSTMAFFALILGPATALAMWALGKKLKDMQLMVQKTESRYSSFLQESIENIMIVKSFSAEERSSAQLKELFLDRLYWIKKKNLLTAFSGSVISFLFAAGYITAFVYGAYRISRGEITFGTMTVFLTLVSQIQGPFIMLARTFPQIISILASAERITEILNLEQEEPKKALEYPALSIGLELKEVDFGYLDDDVLTKSNLKILPGDTIAIVGPSGIGKTTLVRLIMSLIKPRSGEVNLYLDRQAVITAGPSARAFIAYVPSREYFIQWNNRR